MAYNAVNFASNIINKMNEEKHYLDHIKLQKLLYFFAVEYFRQNRELPFVQKIEKWKLGPVIRDVYSEYKFLGANPIEQPTFKFTFSDGNFTSSTIEPEVLEVQDEELLNAVIDNYGRLGSFELVDITHEEEVWIEAKQKIENREEDLFYTNDDFNRIIGRGI